MIKKYDPTVIEITLLKGTIPDGRISSNRESVLQMLIHWHQNVIGEILPYKRHHHFWE
jgi:hypothetical protein